ncbi:YdaS family helix-turn-helix protein [Marinomonas mediterranea]|jgi:hypothetical protein|uniref:Regulatory protein from bacteriophage origin n=1 Tax=Marinomonas mediterranea (strain ATCC 700492 / JCM 21426 / NBRC 103028 / MMB-1) TaxID=717774 RepID=F2JZ53_MARM1|nr:YdaS family helix-turn-helix protein [Marinomonas mediterranea]ADZ92031.1 regulatory protein from bacteriophage origin [Marinomonas mediterranea MMB-1]WCN09998.1 DNA-binding protein [Marinomonas mediterranea]WCN14046.1 DNA-binding protein [Marinomonas mediterranea]WCN18104.1 DNA-binding protein [Marinomonas mediterranea MMB-1]
MRALKDLIKEVDGGVPAVAKACGVSSRAVYKWMKRGRLPRTDYSGETAYALRIEKLSGGRVTASALLIYGRDH